MNPAPPNPLSITIHPIANHKVNEAFIVSGYVSYGIGQLIVMDDKQAPVAKPVKAQISQTPFSFYHPGVTAPGVYTVDVTLEGVSARSAPYYVGTVPVTPTPTPVPTPTPPPVVTPVPPPVVTPPAAVVLTPTSGGTFKDASNNVWTLAKTGSVYENYNAVPGGGSTTKLTIVNNTVYAYDGKSWYTWVPNSKAWAKAPGAPFPGA